MNSLTIKRVLKATQQEVFDAWTNPDKMRMWLSPENLTVKDATSENKVGGAYMVAMHDATKDQIHKATGVFKSFEEGKSFSATWNWEGMNGETLLSIDLKPVSDTQTEITLTHSGFPVQEAADEHEKGWESTLNNFEKHFK